MSAQATQDDLTQLTNLIANSGVTIDTEAQSSALQAKAKKAEQKAILFQAIRAINRGYHQQAVELALQLDNPSDRIKVQRHFMGRHHARLNGVADSASLMSRTVEGVLTEDQIKAERLAIIRSTERDGYYDPLNALYAIARAELFNKFGEGDEDDESNYSEAADNIARAALEAPPFAFELLSHIDSSRPYRLARFELFHLISDEVLKELWLATMSSPIKDAMTRLAKAVADRPGVTQVVSYAEAWAAIQGGLASSPSYRPDDLTANMCRDFASAVQQAGVTNPTLADIQGVMLLPNENGDRVGVGNVVDFMVNFPNPKTLDAQKAFTARVQAQLVDARWHMRAEARVLISKFTAWIVGGRLDQWHNAPVVDTAMVDMEMAHDLILGDGSPTDIARLVRYGKNPGLLLEAIQTLSTSDEGKLSTFLEALAEGSLSTGFYIDPRGSTGWPNNGRVHINQPMDVDCDIQQVSELLASTNATHRDWWLWACIAGTSSDALLKVQNFLRDTIGPKGHVTVFAKYSVAKTVTGMRNDGAKEANVELLINDALETCPPGAAVSLIKWITEPGRCAPVATTDQIKRLTERVMQRGTNLQKQTVIEHVGKYIQRASQ